MVAAMAVSSTGVIRVLPYLYHGVVRGVHPVSTSRSVNSTSTIPLRTTIPASAMIPTPAHYDGDLHTKDSKTEEHTYDGEHDFRAR